LKEHERRQGRERENERPDVLLEYVSTDYLHDGYRTGPTLRNFKRSTGLYGSAWPVYSTRRQLEFKVAAEVNRVVCLPQDD
jgi:hypothetical protein